MRTHGVTVPSSLCHGLARIVRDRLEEERRNGVQPYPAWRSLLADLEAEAATEAVGNPVTPVEVHFFRATEVRWVDSSECATLIGVTERRVVQLAEELGGRKVGGRWRFDPATVKAYVEGR
jgi:hypothetical protein